MHLPSPRRATSLTIGLAAGLLLAAGLVIAALPREGPGEGLPSLPWWVLAVGFLLAERALIHVEIREEAHSLSMSGVVLTLGLFLATPAALLAGRVVGPAVVLLRLRQQPVKLAFNLSLFCAEVALALGLFHLLARGASLDQPVAWVAALAASACADLLGVLTVRRVIRWHSGSPPPIGIIPTMVGSGMSASSLGVVGALVAVTHPLALGLLLALGGVVFLAYRGHAQLTQRYARLNLLYEFTDKLNASDDAAEAVEIILTHARRIMRADGAEVVVVGPDGRPSARQVLRGDGRLTTEPTTPEVVGLLRDALAPGRSMRAPRDTEDPDARRLLQLLDAKDCMVVPLVADGKVIGSLGVGNRLGDVSTFDADDLRLFETLANHASIALDNGRLIGRLRDEVAQREHQALHDALTGLPNRTGFLEACTDALTSTGVSRMTGVLVMDVDRFKEVNDTLGHDAGDELLQEIGRRLATSAPRSCQVARLGGDEFAVLMRDVADLRVALQMGRRLRDVLSAPITINDLDLTIEVSTGLACSPLHGTDPAELLQRADIAMYVAKEDRAGLSVYAPEDDRASRRRLWIAGALRQAVVDQTLFVVFQPKISLVDGATVGAEALVRWHDPVHGFIPPDEFIPLAERTELMAPLTQLVLSQAIRQCRRWHDAGHDLTIAVNIAARSVMDPHVLDFAVRALEAAGLPHGALTLEITESGIMADPERAAVALQRLADTGIRLSVDDFGTGYSSLAYLQRLPVHEVKVDRSFLADGLASRSDAAIVEGIVRLGHALDLSVVAEGIEDERTARRARLLGVDIAQGYHYSRPVQGEDFMGWLVEGPNPPLQRPSPELADRG